MNIVIPSYTGRRDNAVRYRLDRVTPEFATRFPLGLPTMRPCLEKPGRWELAEKFAYLTSLGKLLMMEPPNDYDGASIGRILWTIVGVTPFDPRVVAAALPHDELCKVAWGWTLRKEADYEFKDALRILDTFSAWTRTELYVGVRIGACWRAVAGYPTPPTAPATRGG